MKMLLLFCLSSAISMRHEKGGVEQRHHNFHTSQVRIRQLQLRPSLQRRSHRDQVSFQFHLSISDYILLEK